MRRQPPAARSPPAAEPVAPIRGPHAGWLAGQPAGSVRLASQPASQAAVGTWPALGVMRWTPRSLNNWGSGVDQTCSSPATGGGGGGSSSSVAAAAIPVYQLCVSLANAIQIACLLPPCSPGFSPCPLLSAARHSDVMRTTAHPVSIPPGHAPPAPSFPCPGRECR